MGGTKRVTMRIGPPRTTELRTTNAICGSEGQPSLRDEFVGGTDPNTEVLGYCQMSLRDGGRYLWE